MSDDAVVLHFEVAPCNLIHCPRNKKLPTIETRLLELKSDASHAALFCDLLTTGTLPQHSFGSFIPSNLEQSQPHKYFKAILDHNEHINSLRCLPIMGLHRNVLDAPTQSGASPTLRTVLTTATNESGELTESSISSRRVSSCRTSRCYNDYTAHFPDFPAPQLAPHILHTYDQDTNLSSLLASASNSSSSFQNRQPRTVPVRILFGSDEFPSLSTSLRCSPAHNAWRQQPKVLNPPARHDFNQRLQRLEQQLQSQADQLQTLANTQQQQRDELDKRLNQLLTTFEQSHAQFASLSMQLQQLTTTVTDLVHNTGAVTTTPRKRLDTKSTPTKAPVSDTSSVLPSQANMDELAAMTPFTTSAITTAPSNPPDAPPSHPPRPAPYQAPRVLTPLGKTRSSGTAPSSAAPCKP